MPRQSAAAALVLEEVLSWVRGLPLVALMKHARAFGVGVLVATQNPMDLDYRALSNAGLWCLGRLQTDADRERVIEGLANEANAGMAQAELRTLLKRLAPRWFFVRNVHAARCACLRARHANTLRSRVGAQAREAEVARRGACEDAGAG